MDESLFLALNGLVGESEVFDWTVYFFAVVGIFLFPLFLIKKIHWKRIALHMCTAAFVAYGLNALIAFLWYRERPFHDLPATVLLNTSRLFDSFPSDHAALSAALAMTIALFSRSWGGKAVVLALAGMIGFARVFAGVHYVSDIVAGFGVGCVAAYIIHIFSLRILPEK